MILVFHSYSLTHSKRSFLILKNVLHKFDRIIIGYQDKYNNQLLLHYLKFFLDTNKIEAVYVNNKFNDFSTYLKFMKSYDGSEDVIFCNDSIGRKPKFLFNILLNNLITYSKYRTNYIVGDFDNLKFNKVYLTDNKPLNFWLSTYLFKAKGSWLNDFYKMIISNSDAIIKQLHNDETRFDKSYYLYKKNLPKLRSMICEKELTSFVIDNQINLEPAIYNKFIRKLYKLINRKILY